MDLQHKIQASTYIQILASTEAVLRLYQNLWAWSDHLDTRECPNEVKTVL